MSSGKKNDDSDSEYLFDLSDASFTRTSELKDERSSGMTARVAAILAARTQEKTIRSFSGNLSDRPAELEGKIQALKIQNQELINQLSDAYLKISSLESQLRPEATKVLPPRMSTITPEVEILREENKQLKLKASKSNISEEPTSPVFGERTPPESGTRTPVAAPNAFVDQPPPQSKRMSALMDQERQRISIAHRNSQDVLPVLNGPFQKLNNKF